MTTNPHSHVLRSTRGSRHVSLSASGGGGGVETSILASETEDVHTICSTPAFGSEASLSSNSARSPRTSITHTVLERELQHSEAGSLARQEAQSKEAEEWRDGLRAPPEALRRTRAAALAEQFRALTCELTEERVRELGDRREGRHADSFRRPELDLTRDLSVSKSEQEHELDAVDRDQSTHDVDGWLEGRQLSSADLRQQLDRQCRRAFQLQVSLASTQADLVAESQRLAKVCERLELERQLTAQLTEEVEVERERRKHQEKALCEAESVVECLNEELDIQRQRCVDLVAQVKDMVDRERLLALSNNASAPFRHDVAVQAGGQTHPPKSSRQRPSKKFEVQLFHELDETMATSRTIASTESKLKEVAAYRDTTATSASLSTKDALSATGSNSSWPCSDFSSSSGSNTGHQGLTVDGIAKVALGGGMLRGWRKMEALVEGLQDIA